MLKTPNILVPNVNDLVGMANGNGFNQGEPPFGEGAGQFTWHRLWLMTSQRTR